MAKTDRMLVHKMSNICDEMRDHHYNTFSYKVSPEVLNIPAEGSLEVTLTPLEKFGDGEKLVIVHLISYLFEIVEPTGKEGTQSQIYGFLNRNNAIKFHIALRKEKVPGPINHYEYFYPTPNGFLTVKHGEISSRANVEQMLKSAEFKLGSHGMIANRVDWAKSVGCWEANLDFVERNVHILLLELEYFKGVQNERLCHSEQTTNRLIEMSQWCKSRQLDDAEFSKILQPQNENPVGWKSGKVASSYLPDPLVKPLEHSTKRSPPPKSENRSEKSIASKSSKTEVSGKSARSDKVSKSEKSVVSTKSGKSGKSARSEVQSKNEEEGEAVEMKDKKDKKRKGNPCCDIM